MRAAGSVGEDFGERGGRQQPTRPCLDLLDGSRRDLKLDEPIDLGAEALSQ